MFIRQGLFFPQKEKSISREKKFIIIIFWKSHSLISKRKLFVLVCCVFSTISRQMSHSLNHIFFIIEGLRRGRTSLASSVLNWGRRGPRSVFAWPRGHNQSWQGYFGWSLRLRLSAASVTFRYFFGNEIVQVGITGTRLEWGQRVGAALHQRGCRNMIIEVLREFALLLGRHGSKVEVESRLQCWRGCEGRHTFGG